MKTVRQVDFDCMVEVAFSDQNAFLAYMGKLFGPKVVDDAVAVDEAKFLDRSQMRIRRRRPRNCWMRASPACRTPAPDRKSKKRRTPHLRRSSLGITQAPY
jgi:hypothetical protein